jgi:hypothetical protein
MTLMTETIPTISRRPHFRRHDPPPVLVTDDDIAIIRYVAEHRLRRSTDICKLMSHRPAKKIIERIGTLYHTGYLDRPRAQRDYFSANKRRPAYIYALGNRGAELIAQLDGIDPPKTDWTDKNRDIGRPFIHHRLLIADVLTAFKFATQARADVRFIEPAEILERAPETTRNADNPWKWKARVPTPGGAVIDKALVPDAAFGLDFTAERKKFFFFLEADRATMPVWRSNLSQTSMYSKFLTYFHGHRAGYHTRTYNITNFRVLTCTTSSDRTANMVDMLKQKIAPSNMFLFTDATALQNIPDVLALAWTSGKGQPVRLDG